MMAIIVSCMLFLLQLILSKKTWRTGSHQVIIGCMMFALLSYGFFIMRLDGQLADSDTALMSVISYATGESGSFVDSGASYPHGAGYLAITSTLVQLTDLSVADVQRYLYPLISALLLPPIIFMTYRTLLKQITPALLGTVLLLLQTDFIWVTWRGSHERFTWAFGLTLLYLAVRYQKDKNKLQIATYLLVGLAMITTNYVFAFAFNGMLLFAGLTASLVERNRTRWQPVILLSVLNISMAIIFARIIYTPADEGIIAFSEIIDRVYALIFEGQSSPTSTAAVLWWQNPIIFILLTALNWFVLGIASCWWVYRVQQVVRQQGHQLAVQYWLFPAIGLALFTTLLTDRAGILGGNFFIRLMPLLFIISVPIAAEALHLARYRWRHYPRLVRVTSLTIVTYFVIVLLIKVPSEPSLNTKWLVTTTDEDQAMRWVIEENPNSIIWTGLDERFESDEKIENPSAFTDYFLEIVWGEEPRLLPDFYVLSEQEQERFEQVDKSAPDMLNLDQVYDNGAVQIYRTGNE